MSLKPIYAPENTANPAFHLRYTWAGWPSSSSSSSSPCTLPELDKETLDNLATDLSKDQIHLLEHAWSPGIVHLTCSTMPQVSPILVAARLKGRLQHLLRKQAQPVSFSRKVSVRSLGDNRSKQVERYIAQQTDTKSLDPDPSFAEFLKSLAFIDDTVDLSVPWEARSGRYWYNLHLVLVTQERHRSRDRERLSKVRRQCLAIASKKGHRIRAFSVMPEHVHLALRGNTEHTPEEIALGFLNNLAYVLGQNAVWQFGYYVGTFGEFDMNAVRRGG